MTNRDTLRIVLALGTNDLLDLRFEQLAQHTQTDLDRQSRQSLPRGPDQLPRRLLHPLREHSLIVGRLSDRYVAGHGGSSFGSWRIAHHAPTRSGRAGGTAVTSKFYEPRDNLPAGAGASWVVSC
jgi:hypothetical protein